MVSGSKKKCIVNKNGVMSSLQIDFSHAVGSQTPSSGAKMHHYIGTQLLPMFTNNCEQILEIDYGRREDATTKSERGSVRVVAVSRSIHGIPGTLPPPLLSEDDKIKEVKVKNSRFSVDGNNIEFHCRSVSQGIIAIDFSVFPSRGSPPIAIYYAWEELPLPQSGIEYSRMLGIISGDTSRISTSLNAERIWAPAAKRDHPIRTLCLSVHALTNGTSSYDLIGEPYYQNPYQNVFDLVKGTDWERDTNEKPSRDKILQLISPLMDNFIEIENVQESSEKASVAASDNTQKSSSTDKQVNMFDTPSSSDSSDLSSSTAANKPKRNSRTTVDEYSDVRNRIIDQSHRVEYQDRPLVPFLLVSCIALAAALWHRRPISKIAQQLVLPRSMELSSSKKRVESADAIALRSAMMKGGDSAKLSTAIRNAELNLESVDIAILRRARTILAERRRLEKLAEIQRKKAAARNRSHQEAAARIAIKKQEALMEREAFAKLNTRDETKSQAILFQSRLVEKSGNPPVENVTEEKVKLPSSEQLKKE